MATTTNFGWETPDDTDLVKDGAAAIRTALNGVDTSFLDLKGGTTGQFLSKASNTNLDYSWVAAPSSPIRQVVSTTANTSVSNSNSTLYVDTGLTATITPSSSTSKILAIFNHQSIFRTSTADQMLMRFFRGATMIYETSLMYLPISIGAGMEGTCILVHMDSPATTSAVTYKTQFRPSGSAACTVQSSNFPSSLTLMEIGA
jgi:hypothetical protein